MTASDPSPASTRYRLKFLPEALAEWNALDGSVKEVLKKLLKKRLDQPRLPGADQNERQEALVDALKDARGKLALLLQDEFFREDLAEDWRVAVLHRMLDDMTKAGNWLASESYRPVKKQDKENVETSTSSTRQIANRLADACFRIYANCDEKVLKLLLAYEWLKPISVAQSKALILESLERKIDQFNRKLPNEDYVGTGLFGQWLVSRDIDPPWMAA